MFQKKRNSRMFQKALCSTDDGGMVCATIMKDGEPRYFTMDRDASDEEVRAEAFRIRNGRPMSPLESKLLNIAQHTRTGP